MSFTPPRWTVRVVPLTLLLASGALAANDDTKAAPTPSESATPQDALAQSKDYVSKMQTTLRRVVSLQEKARKQRDIIMLNCVNDKLLQVKGYLAVNDQAISSLNEVIAKGDDAGRGHQLARVAILHQKVTVLGTEAENCVGQDLSYVGASRVEVEISPNIPINEVTTPPFPRLDVSRPPIASPT